ncbi:MAG: PAS domain-containing protein [Sphingobacteriia bacterium]
MGAWFFLKSHVAQEALQAEIKQDRTTLADLQALQAELNNHIGYLQVELLQLQVQQLYSKDQDKWGFSGSNDFKASALPSPSRVRALFDPDPDRLGNNDRMDGLSAAIGRMNRAYAEFKRHVQAGDDLHAKDAYTRSVEQLEKARPFIDGLIRLKTARLQERLDQATAHTASYQQLFYALVGGIILLVVLAFIVVSRSLHRPLKQMLSRMQRRQKLKAVNNELGQIASYVNRVQAELDATELAVTQAAAGQIEFAIQEDHLQQRQVTALQELKGQFRRFGSELHAKETELRQQQERIRKLEEGIAQAEATYEAHLAAIQSQMAVLEYDPSGSVHRVNDYFAQLTGVDPAEVVGRNGDGPYSPHEGSLAQMWSTVSNGASWKGIIKLKSKQHPNGLMLAATATRLKQAGPDNKDKVILAGVDITRIGEERETFEEKLKQANTELEAANRQLQLSQTELDGHRNRLQEAEAELAQRQAALTQAERSLQHKNEELDTASAAVDSAIHEAEHNRAQLDQLQQELELARQELEQAREQVSTAELNLQQFNAEHEQVQANFEQQKRLELRLVQQQSAMQELTRNHDLKQGNVREAVRTVTEAAAFALDVDRVGMWLFIDNGSRLRCLDLFIKKGNEHSQAPDLLERDLQLFFQSLKKETILAAGNPRAEAATANMVPIYLEPFGIQRVLAVAVRLGGNHVGLVMAEHAQAPHPWTLDEQNFLLAVADVVSLALEQGNRRAMEEELRMTLEESQALEEELRQNAEEIEATNEEMRRTQVELRGQIAALNNAAIVCETNLEGRVTYANTAFSEIYRYEQKEVLGKNLNILQSGMHDSDFWMKLWHNISQGMVYQGEICNKAKDGSLIWTDVTITPVLGIDGTPFKYISVAFDITSRKLQEEQIQRALDIAVQQEELLRMSSTEMETANTEMRRTQIELAGQINALNNSSLVFETDMEGQIIYVNEALLRVSGYEKQDLIGNRFNILRSGRQSENLYQDQWKSILNGKIWRGELENVCKDGSYLWSVVTSTPVLNEHGEPIKTIHVLFDITEQKQQEFRLKKQQTALSKLSAHPAVKEGNVEKAFEEIAQIARETMDVTRAAIWIFNEQHDILECRTVNQQGEHVYTPGTRLAADLYPTYFHTLERDRLIAAQDAQEDPRTRELSPGLFEPGDVKSVIDAVITVGVDMVGVLSLESKARKRAWTLDEQSFANSLAELVGLVLEQKERMLTDRLKEAYAELELKNHDIALQKAELEETTSWLKESIRYAKRIQQNILPSKAFMDEHLDNYFVVYRPKDVVGGDFYWFGQIGNQCVMVVADGTGHGVPGAFLTLIGYLLLNQIVLEKRVVQPSEILRLLHLGVRTALKQDEEEGSSRDGFDVAVCTFSTRTYEVEYAGANLPFYYYQDWEIHEIKPTKKSIGGEQLEEERTFQNHTIQLRQGDAIYMYTDGFVDQLGGPDEKRFTSRRFRDLILRTQHESLGTQRALLNLEWKDWKEDREQLDDVTVFGLKFS